jgi:hypothetical protein
MHFTVVAVRIKECHEDVVHVQLILDEYLE